MLATDREIVSESVINILIKRLLMHILAARHGKAVHKTTKNSALRNGMLSAYYNYWRQNSNILCCVVLSVCRQKGRLLNKRDKNQMSQPYPTCYLPIVVPWSGQQAAMGVACGDARSAVRKPLMLSSMPRWRPIRRPVRPWRCAERRVPLQPR